MTVSGGESEGHPADALPLVPNSRVVKLPATRGAFILAQKDAVTLAKCHSLVVPREEAKTTKTTYIYNNSLLMRFRSSSTPPGETIVYQAVVPTAYRLQV